MSTRKIESNYSKTQKKRRIETLIVSQKRVMNKFIQIDKNELKYTSGYSLDKQDNNNIDIGENNNRKREVVTDDDSYDSQT